MVSRQSRQYSNLSSYLAGHSLLKFPCRELIAHAVTVSSVVLVALGYASPPVSTWTDGICDDADYDDVVRLEMEGMGASHSSAPVRVEYRLKGFMLLAAPAPRPVGIVCRQTNRGPPIDERSLCPSSASLCPS
jgi:hypothetical protein